MICSVPPRIPSIEPRWRKFRRAFIPSNLNGAGASGAILSSNLNGVSASGALLSSNLNDAGASGALLPSNLDGENSAAHSSHRTSMAKILPRIHPIEPRWRKFRRTLLPSNLNDENSAAHSFHRITNYREARRFF
jgi:hypothetical protein